MVRAVFPTPPSPNTTSLYSTIRPAMMTATAKKSTRGERSRCKREEETQGVEGSRRRRTEERGREEEEGGRKEGVVGDEAFEVMDRGWLELVRSSSRAEERRRRGTTGGGGGLMEQKEL